MEKIAAKALWFQARMPVSMRFRRKFRPLLFRFVMPILQYRRKKNADTEVDGLTLRTKLEVFHPNYFFSSKILGRYLAPRVAANQKVLDMGTGAGLIGIIAAKRGAQVLAVDINPTAVALTTENARRHALNGRWRCLESDLFTRLDPMEKFDWIVFNPPYFAGSAQRPEEAAWYAGENYETIDRFLEQAKNFLTAIGKVVLILSSDMPLALLQDKFQRFDYRLAAHESKSHLFEIFHLVQLQAGEGQFEFRRD